MSHHTLQQELREAIKVQLEGYENWKQTEGGHTFAEIEAKALEVGREMMRAMIAYGVKEERQVEQEERPGAEPDCRTCGRRMRYGGRQRKRVESQVGTIEMEREYYVCAACRCGLFPPG
jgi:hypothetical protein